MGKLIIDGNNVFEIDEECIKNKRVAEECDIKKYFQNETKQENDKTKKRL